MEDKNDKQSKDGKDDRPLLDKTRTLQIILMFWDSARKFHATAPD